ncbi:unnamed protein product [Closterium sp. NIES-64]|nr:unnamed protein product [Closterium sp. NIES-64]
MLLAAGMALISVFTPCLCLNPSPSTPTPLLPHTRTSASPHPHLRFPTPAPPLPHTRAPSSTPHPHLSPIPPPTSPPPLPCRLLPEANTYTVPPEANVSQVLECGYQSSTATLFGIIGGMLLAAGMALISVLGGCVCCVTIQYAHGQALKVSIVCYTLACTRTDRRSKTALSAARSHGEPTALPGRNTLAWVPIFLAEEVCLEANSLKTPSRLPQDSLKTPSRLPQEPPQGGHPSSPRYSLIHLTLFHPSSPSLQGGILPSGDLVAFFLAEICLMSGGSLNNYHKEVTNYQYDFQLRTCYQLKTSTYIVGAVMSILTVVFAVLYYGQAQKSKYEAWVEQGAPTPRLYSLETMKSFVIAGPARAGPLKSEDDDEDEDDMGDEEEEEYDVFDEEEEDDDDTRPLNPRRHDDDDDDNDGNRAH